MNGPVPTMVDMLMETALSRPNLRGRWVAAVLEFAGFVPVRTLKRTLPSVGRRQQNTRFFW